MKKRWAALLLALCMLAAAVSVLCVQSFADEEEMYAKVVEEAGNGTEIIPVYEYSMPVSQLQTFMERVLYNNPELFYFTSYRYAQMDEIVYDIRPNYVYTGQEREDAIAEFHLLAQKLYDLVDEGWSEEALVLFYHDYLASNYTYDQTYSIYDAYSFLKNGTGVCQAYALTFKLLMDHFGIPCTFAVSDDMHHMWNLVQLRGVWYHVDVTHDDPVNASDALLQHKFLLTGQTTTEQIKPDAGSVRYGLPVVPGENDHPLYGLLSGSRTPVAETGGRWYAITQTAGETALCEFDPVTGTSEILRSLQYRWPAGQGASYVGNYSGLCTDGRYLYFSSCDTVFLFDPLSGGDPSALSEPLSGDPIYGLRFEDGVLSAFTGASPTEKSYTQTALAVDLPVYFTVTWVIGEQSIITFAPRDSDPESSFNGSTFKEDEKGVRYIFTGWTPALHPVECDVVYTALYRAEKLYKPGDCNGDDLVSIEDVTVLLNRIATETTDLDFWAADLDEDGILNIEDVTALLNLLALGTTE